MEITNLNRSAIKNLSDNEIVSFCDFKKPEWQLDNVELLIFELTNRLERSNDHITFLDTEIHKLKEGID